MTPFLNKKISFLILILLPVSIGLYAQRPQVGNSMRVPIYRSKNDSIQIVKLDLLIDKLASELTPKKRRSIDSVFQVRQRLAGEAVLGFRYIYFSSPGFV